MSVHMVEILAPRGSRQEVRQTLDAFETGQRRESAITNTLKSIKFFVKAERSTKLFDIFSTRFRKNEEFRIIITSVEATMPRISDEELPDAEMYESAKTDDTKRRANPGLVSIHREALYQKVITNLDITTNKLILFGLSAIVAAIGLKLNNIPIVIGSMVIAPFLGPNVGLALGSTLGDKDLIYKSLRELILGTIVVLAIAITWGWLDAGVVELTDWIYLSYSMIILSFVSGVAAILYLLQDNDSGLVGVMVAVSLIPPLTLAGLLFGAGAQGPAAEAFLLFLANITCLNLAGIGTFWLAGIRPTLRREAKKAQKNTRHALMVWSILLAVLLAATYVVTF